MKIAQEKKTELSRKLRDTQKAPFAAPQLDAWLNEAEQRLREFDAGESPGVPAAEVFRDLDAKLR